MRFAQAAPPAGLVMVGRRFSELPAFQ